MTRRRVEISFERERLLVVGRRRVSITDWCGGCGARVRMVMPDEAARLTGATARKVYRLVETGRLHYLEVGDMGLLVCVESLTKISKNFADVMSANEEKEETDDVDRSS